MPASQPGYSVRYAKDGRQAPSFEWIGAAASPDEARSIADSLLEDARGRDWLGMDPKGFALWTRRMTVEPLERIPLHMATLSPTDFTAAGSRAKRLAPAGRIVLPGQIAGITIRMASQALAAILATDPAYAMASATDGACATLRRSWSNNDPAKVRIAAEAGMIESGRDETAAGDGPWRTCVLRASREIILSNATQVAAIHLAKATMAIENGDRAFHGSDIPHGSATARAASAAAIPQRAMEGAKRAARLLRGMGRPEAARAIEEQALSIARR